MTAARPEPAINHVMRSALKWDAIIVGAIAVVAVVIGAIFAGGVGVTSALIGAAMGLVFLGITAASILFANRYAGGELFAGIFFAIVLGGWIIKFIVFIVIAVLLRHQPWVNACVLFLSIIAGVLGSLFVDVVVVIRSRIPIEVGPGERGTGASGEKE
jgi:hypothetical protein